MPHDGGIDLPKARFHRMDEGTQEDWMAIVQHELPFQAQQADRLLDHLKLLKDEAGGFAMTVWNTASRRRPAPIRPARTRNMSSAPCSTTWATCWAAITTPISRRRS